MPTANQDTFTYTFKARNDFSCYEDPFEDPDEEMLNLTAELCDGVWPVWLFFELVEGSNAWMLVGISDQRYDDFCIRITASDILNENTSVYVHITFENNPPEITSIEDISVTVGKAFKYTSDSTSVTDRDNDEIIVEQCEGEEKID